MTPSRFKFAAARRGESIVHGAERPGYNATRIEPEAVREWTGFMKEHGIQRVCCLLSPAQLSYYTSDLLAQYRQVFGPGNVCHEPVEDYHLCDRESLERTILPFLASSDADGARVVVHCSGGSGRTGHVLAAWLVRHRGLCPDQALAAVEETGRNPREAVRCGNATEDELRTLLLGRDNHHAV